MKLGKKHVVCLKPAFLAALWCSMLFHVFIRCPAHAPQHKLQQRAIIPTRAGAEHMHQPNEQMIQTGHEVPIPPF
jgi:hypothetical protein